MSHTSRCDSHYGRTCLLDVMQIVSSLKGLGSAERAEDSPMNFECY